MFRQFSLQVLGKGGFSWSSRNKWKSRMGMLSCKVRPSLIFLQQQVCRLVYWWVVEETLYFILYSQYFIWDGFKLEALEFKYQLQILSFTDDSNVPKQNSTATNQRTESSQSRSVVIIVIMLHSWLSLRKVTAISSSMDRSSWQDLILVWAEIVKDKTVNLTSHKSHTDTSITLLKSKIWKLFLGARWISRKSRNNR